MILSPEQKEKYSEVKKVYNGTKRGHVVKYLSKAKYRTKNNNIPFDLDLDYLLSIATDICPVFGTPFHWGRNKGERNRHTPSLDRIIPELGYVKGNVAFISTWANTIKSDATEKELYAVADWLHKARKNVRQKPTTPVPEGTNSQGAIGAELRPFSTTGFGKNYDHTYNHSRTVQWQDADHCTQASSGDSVGRGGQEVVAPETLTCIEDHGQPDAEIVRLDFGRRYLSD